MEHFFTCPYCWQRISMIIDTSIGEDHYIEDCEVCCNPIEIDYAADEDILRRFSVIKAQSNF